MQTFPEFPWGRNDGNLVIGGFYPPWLHRIWYKNVATTARKDRQDAEFLSTWEKNERLGQWALSRCGKPVLPHYSQWKYRTYQASFKAKPCLIVGITCCSKGIHTSDVVVPPVWSMRACVYNFTYLIYQYVQKTYQITICTYREFRYNHYDMLYRVSILYIHIHDISQCHCQLLKFQLFCTNT